MTTVCSGCARIKVNGEWVIVPDRPATDRDSHGICPDCSKIYYPPKATRFDCVNCRLRDLDGDGVPDGCGQVKGEPCIAPGKRSPWDKN